MSGAPQAELLQKVLEKAGIPADYDILLVGDGSGNGWQQPCGWASILIEKESRGRQLFHGGMNAGSINLAELMPYFQALLWYHSQYGHTRLHSRGTLRVHILTDSRVVANAGNQTADPRQPLPKFNRAIWAGMRELGKTGYVIKFHWGRRSESSLNWAADLIAALSRRAVMDAGENPVFPQRAAGCTAGAIGNVQFCDPLTGAPISVYHLNPSDPGEAP